MRNKISKLLICLLAIALSFSVLPISASENSVAASMQESIIKYHTPSSGNLQNFIDTTLTENAGTGSEWYILSLSQTGNYSFSDYKEALIDYLGNNEIYSATTRQKYALALVSIGGTEDYISTTINDSIGKLGIMSWIYGLHLLNNGYTAESHTASSVKEKILSLKKENGGWAVTGKVADTDATAMAIQCLAPYYSTDTAVKAAIDEALELLSSMQGSDGIFSSYGKGNAESCAQVLTALSALGIDPQTDSRFIKNGNTLLDAIKAFRLSDGSFCHIIGEGYSTEATAQVYFGLSAYLRMKAGKGNIYLFDKARPSIPQNQENTVSVPESTEVSAAQSSSLSASPSVSGDSLTDSSVSQTVESSADTQSSQISEAFPETTPSNETENNTAEPKKPFDYKLWVSIGIAVLAIAALSALFFLKKLTRQNILLVLGSAVVLILGICFINISSAEDHYNSSLTEDTVGSVTITVKCDTVAGKAEHIPKNGIILEAARIEFSRDETVFDALNRAAKKNKLLIESNRSSGPLYVRGIANIYEFDFGDLSGWVYTVNGEKSYLGCDEYTLKDGDIIEWHYSLELGEDIE